MTAWKEGNAGKSGRRPGPARRLYTERAARVFERLYRFADAAAAWEALSALLERGERAEALRRAAASCASAARIPEAALLLDAALEVCRDAGDLRVEGLVLADQAALVAESGQRDGVEERFRRALELHGAAGDREARAATLGNFANVVKRWGRMEEAERSYREVLGEARVLGDRRLGRRRSVGIHLCRLACVRIAEGDAESARRHWQEGLECLRAVSDPSEIERKTAEMRRACSRAGIPAFA